MRYVPEVNQTRRVMGILRFSYSGVGDAADLAASAAVPPADGLSVVGFGAGFAASGALAVAAGLAGFGGG